MKRLFLILSLVLALCGAAFAEVNVNTATQDELDSLKGVGPVKARAIVDYRAKNGPFKSVDELRNVTGIGQKTLEDIRKEVTVSGPGTTMRPAAAMPKPAVSAAPAKAMETSRAATAAKATEPAKADAQGAKRGKKDDTKPDKK